MNMRLKKSIGICLLVVFTVLALTGGINLGIATNVKAADTALNRSAWVLNASRNASVVNNVKDGDTSTRWDTGWLQQNDQWFTIDLGSAQTFYKVVLDSLAAPGDCPVGYALYVSTDGTNWGTAIASGAGSAVTTITFTAQTKRYIKIAQTGTSSTNYWSIYELNVYNSTSTPTPTAAPTPTPSGSSKSIPGTIEAESYNSMSGIETESCSDTGGGQDVGWIEAGDWMDYNVNVQTSGSYTVQYRVASINTTGQIQLKKSDGTILATTNVPNTGGWQTWQTVTATVTLSAGSQTLRVYASGGGFNINWISFAASATATPTPAGTNAVPGKIEAENYNSMYGVSLETCSDTGGGQDVGWTDAGDWMDYNVNVATSGTYTVNYRVASMNGGGSFELKNGSTVLSTINVPNTGGWQTWQTVSATAYLNAGSQTLRVNSTAGGWNLNWLDFATGGQTSTPTSAATPTPGPTPSGSNEIGMNLSYPGDSSEIKAFADLIKMTRPAGSVQTPYDLSAPLDSNGCPTTDFGLFLWDSVANMNGTYKLSFTGQASVSGVTNLAYDSSTNTTTADFIVTETGPCSKWLTLHRKIPYKLSIYAFTYLARGLFL